MAHEVSRSSSDGSPSLSISFEYDVEGSEDKFESSGVAVSTLTSSQLSPPPSPGRIDRNIRQETEKTTSSDFVEDELSSRAVDEEEEKQAVLFRTLSLSLIPSPSHDLEKPKPPRIPTPRAPRIHRTSSLRDTKNPNRIERLTKTPSFRRKKDSRFPHILTCPVLRRDDWKRTALRKLEQFAHLKATLDPRELVKKFAKISLNTTTILRRIREAQKFEDLPFLTPFLAIRDPKAFLKAAKKLHKKREYPIFLEVIGGKTALSLLKLCQDRKVHKGWVVYLERARGLGKACELSETRVIHFKPNFDKERPVANAKYDDVRDSFRFFFSSDLDKSETFFRLNGVPLTPPDVDKDTSCMEQKKAFMTWLITECDHALSFTPNLDPSEQATLVCQGAITVDDKNALQAKLTAYFEENGVGAIKTILEQLKPNGFPKAFRRWAQKEIEQFLETDGPPDCKELASQITQEFERHFNLTTIKSEVPSYRILQSLSFGAFSTVPFYLRRKLCPELFSNVVGQPHMKSFPTDASHFDIKINGDTNHYEATQIKLYRFYQRGRTDESHIMIGSVELHWTICGVLGSDTRTAKLHMHNLRLDHRESLDIRCQVVAALDLPSL